MEVIKTIFCGFMFMIALNVFWSTFLPSLFSPLAILVPESALAVEKVTEYLMAQRMEFFYFKRLFFGRGR